jgi:hypothetical protein
MQLRAMVQTKPEDISEDRREANVYAAKNANSIIRARFAEERVSELQRAVDLMHTEGDEDAEVIEKLQARVKELEDVLRDFAEHGTRHDTCPTHYRFENLEQAERYWLGWVKSMDDGVRRRASEWLDGASPAEPVVATASALVTGTCHVCGMIGEHKMSCYPHNRAPQGSDEAGGEGPAAAPTPPTDFPAIRQAVMRGENVEALLAIVAHLEAKEAGRG